MKIQSMHHGSIEHIEHEMKTMYLFFKVETTGLPNNYQAPVSDSNNWPRLVMLTFRLADQTGLRIDSKSMIIKPIGYTIPMGSVAIHGITTEQASQEGSDLVDGLQQFNNLIDEADFIVSHNVEFGKKILLAEYYRNSIPTNLSNKPSIDIMKAGTDYLQLSGPLGFKFPKLSELYSHLFAQPFDEVDGITAIEQCFWEMKQLQII